MNFQESGEKQKSDCHSFKMWWHQICHYCKSVQDLVSPFSHVAVPGGGFIAELCTAIKKVAL